MNDPVQTNQFATKITVNLELKYQKWSFFAQLKSNRKTYKMNSFKSFDPLKDQNWSNGFLASHLNGYSLRGIIIPHDHHSWLSHVIIPHDHLAWSDWGRYATVESLGENLISELGNTNPFIDGDSTLPEIRENLWFIIQTEIIDWLYNYFGWSLW